MFTPYLAKRYAEERQTELLREAEHARLVLGAERAQLQQCRMPRLTAWLGHRMVEWGERMLDMNPPESARHCAGEASLKCKS